MNQERTEYILKVLNKVYRDGYRPARRDESYFQRLKNGLYANQYVNCMGHIFNLRNQQFDDYEIEPYKLYSHGYTDPYFMGFMKNAYKYDETAQNLLYFIKETGLKVEECASNEIITDFKSWKIALYFCAHDFHFMIEDSPQIWSGKIGNKSVVEKVYGEKPPAEYHNQVDTFPSVYKFYNTYKLTNQNADENNRYVKDRTI